MSDEHEPTVEETAEEQIVTEEETQEEPDAPEPPPKAWSDDDEQEARLFGWKSSDEWQGEKPPGYIDNPQEFLDRVQRSRIFKTMQDKLQSTEQQAADLARKQEEMNRRALERQRSLYEARMAEIAAGQRKAVEEADTAAYDRYEKQKAELQKVQAEPQQPQSPHPEVAAYAQSETGRWLQNPILQDTARKLIDANPEILRKGPKDQIEYAEAEIRKMYPAYFPQQPSPDPKPRQTPVDPGGIAPSGMQGRTAFDKLPGDAKAQFKRFVEEGLFKDTKADREEFANDFNAA